MSYCRHGYDKPGWPQQPHAATGWLCAPGGQHIDPMCLEHAKPVIAEYRDKLGEVWRFSNLK
jgi:hypothetical protein